jgi:AraC family transcriptional regulator, transcriptional activator of pobA
MAQQIPVHELAEPDDLHCKILRLNVPTDYSTNEAHRHSYYELLFFERGTGKHMIDFDTYEISGKSFHFVSAGQVHALSRSEDTQGYVIAFSKEFLILNGTDANILYDFPAFNKTGDPFIALKDNDFIEVEALVKNMEEVFKRDEPYKEKMLGAFISILLFKCKPLFKKDSGGKLPDALSGQLMQKFNKLVEEKFVELHKVSDYADLLNVSPNYLSETIKKVSGKTAGEQIQDRLILEAKRLLLHSSISAKEVSYQLNFNDPSYFSRFFKTNTGMSPEEFRKQIREKYQH